MIERIFVAGHPISHSKSPVIHNFWIEEHKLSATYETIDILSDQIDGLFSDIRSGKYMGGNITIPHKELALDYCDIITPEAKTIGAINTIYVQNNQIFGHNTDCYGFLANLDQQIPGWDKNLKKIIVLGAGGASRAVLMALISRGAENITILNRTLKNAQILADHFSNFSKSVKFNTGNIESFHEYAFATNLLVNTSSIGLNNTGFTGVDLELLPKNAIVHDIVYIPQNTPLLQSAKNCNLQTADGLGMLLHQAAPAFEKWFNIFPKVNDQLYELILDEIDVV